MTGGPARPDDLPAPLFHEPGARWRTVAFGPLFCLAALVIELATGPVVHWVALPLMAVVLAGFAYIMVVAGRRHVSVELTETVLRQGTEELPVADIEAVLAAADPEASDPARWENARTLGELSGVPRKRTAVGLRLRGGTFVRAWARDDAALRNCLDSLVSRRAH